METLFKILGQGYSYMAILWFVSYHRSFKKREWISYYDEKNLKLMPEYANQGYYKDYYTIRGAVVRSLGFGGIISLILIKTDGLFLIGALSWGLIGLLDTDMGWAIVVFAGIVSSILYYRRLRDNIVR